jgi:hypothetical protein
MTKKDRRTNVIKDSTQSLRMMSKTKSAMKEFQNQEHNTQKEALGPNTKR